MVKFYLEGLTGELGIVLWNCTRNIFINTRVALHIFLFLKHKLVGEIEEQEFKLDLSEEEKMRLKDWIHWATMHGDRLNPIKKL